MRAITRIRGEVKGKEGGFKIVSASGVQAVGDAFISWIRGPITESWQTPR